MQRKATHAFRLAGCRIIASWGSLMLLVASTSSAQSVPNSPTQSLSRAAVVIDGAITELEAFRGLFLSADGKVLGLAKPRGEGLALYSAQAGTRLGHAGRSGEGPGELRILSNFGTAGGEVWITDASLARLSFFDGAGRFARSIRLPSLQPGAGPRALPGTDRVRLGIIGVRTEGRLVSRVLPKYRDLPEWFRPDASPIIETDMEGRFLRILAWEPKPRGECLKEYTTPGGTASIFVPFCPMDLVRVPRNGRYLAVLSHGTPSKNRSPFSITLLGPGGDTLFSRTLTVRAERVTAQARDSALQAIERTMRMGRARTGGLRPEDRAALTSLAVAETYPATQDLLVGEDGVVWIRVHADGPRQHWLALDVAGSLIGRYAFDAGVAPVSSNGRTVWAVSKDEDDVPSIVRYTFR